MKLTPRTITIGAPSVAFLAGLIVCRAGGSWLVLAAAGGGAIYVLLEVRVVLSDRRRTRPEVPHQVVAAPWSDPGWEQRIEEQLGHLSDSVQEIGEVAADTAQLAAQQFANIRASQGDDFMAVMPK